MQMVQPRWEGEWTLPVDSDAQVLVTVDNTSIAQGTMGLDSVQLQAEIPVTALTVAQKGIVMVTGLELGEESLQERPSVILCRAGDESLWELAKRCGSTVEAITKANDLQEQPGFDKMLLIPVV